MKINGFTVFISIFFVFALTYACTKSDIHEEWEKEAIERGYGVYKEGEFKWREE